MSYISQIPKLNNIQMVPVGVEPTSKYHSVPFDKQWFKEHIENWQRSANYKQKVQQADQQYLTISRQGTQTIDLYVYDCEQEEVSEITLTMKIDAAGVYSSQSGDVTLCAQTFAFKFQDLSLDEGTYYLYAAIPYYADEILIETKHWISEPIDLKDEHEDTVLIEAWNDTNKDDVIFKYTGDYTGSYVSPKFGLRVEGQILDPVKYTSANVDFVDQNEEIRQDYSQGWIVKQLMVGGDLGIPPYLLEKINLYLCCDNVYIDGRRISKDEGADWETDKAPNYPLYIATIDIRDYNRQDSFTDNRGALIEVHDLPGYPFAVWDIKTPSGLRLLGGYGWNITDGTIKAGYIGYLNSTVNSLYGFAGEWFEESGKLYYQCATGESLFFEGVVIEDPLIVDVETTAPGAQYGVNYRNGLFMFSWGDGVANSISGDNTIASIAHTYAGTGTFSLYVYQAVSTPALTYLNLVGSDDAKATDWSGQVMINLEWFGMANNSMGAMSLAPLQIARASLKRIALSYNEITSFTSQLCTANPQGGIFTPEYFNWSQLNFYQVFGNQLNSTQTTAFISDLRNNTLLSHIKTINCKQQPAATLNSPATTYKTDMIAAGWAVVTD